MIWTFRAILLTTVAVIPGQAAPTGTLQAGAARIDITPAAALPMSGDAGRKEGFKGIFSMQSAPGPTFEVDLWPGEGRPVFEAVAQQLRLHELPSESSKVVETVRVRPRQRLAFDETRYRTMKPGRVFVLASTGITGRRLGDVSRLVRSDGVVDSHHH